MTHSEATHKMLIMGIIASISFTVYVASLLFGEISTLNANMDTVLTKLGFIEGVVSRWESYPP